MRNATSPPPKDTLSQVGARRLQGGVAAWSRRSCGAIRKMRPVITFPRRRGVEGQRGGRNSPYAPRLLGEQPRPGTPAAAFVFESPKHADLTEVSPMAIARAQPSSTPSPAPALRKDSPPMKRFPAFPAPLAPFRLQTAPHFRSECLAKMAETPRFWLPLKIPPPSGCVKIS